MDSTVYVVNHSTLVADRDVAAMTAAIAKQVAQHLAPAHLFTAPPVLFVPHTAAPPARQARIVAVQDVCDDPDALGYHTEDGAEHVWGVVGCKAVLDQGAKPLTGAYAVSTILSHEVLEMVVDPWCSGWFDSGAGWLAAYEVGDPVQSDWYPVDGVAVSNFVTAAWFNPMAAPSDRFDHLGKLRHPFTMSKGGYLVQMRGGRTTEKFGEDMPAWLREMKRQRVTRTQRLGQSEPSAAATEGSNA